MATLNFKGQPFVQNYHLTVKYHELIPRKDTSFTDKMSLHDNLILHGDNLKALKALLPLYAGKVKCIYIDPPYNTGNEKWAYNDNVNSPMMQEWLGKVVDIDDLTRHDKWLCMMMPRLKILRELLSEDGLIFVSIDDNELHRLKNLMDEIFHENNFYAQINWSARSKPMNAGVAKFKFQKSEEYVLVYGLIPMDKYLPFKLEESGKKEYNKKDKNGEPYRLEEIQQRKNIGVKRSEKMVFSILGVYPQEGYRWTIGEDTARLLEKNGHVEFVKSRVHRWLYKKEEDESSYHPLWANFADSCGTSEDGKAELFSVLGNDEFETVKPIDLIKRLLFHFTDKDSIILDSFAGSGTTAHAVLALNKEDGGHRKFILIECEDYADQITAERVRRVMKGIPNAKDQALREGLGGTFSYFDLGKAIEMESLLEGKNLPSYTELARYVFYTATGEEFDESQIIEERHFIGESKEYEVYLFYQPDLEYLKKTALTLEHARALGHYNGKRRLVFAPTKYLDQEHLLELHIAFAQLPFEIYQLAR